MSRLVAVSMAFVALFLNAAMATNYTVGAPKGSWDATSNLQAWSKAQTFTVGDSLIFQYAPSHDVVEVSKADYDGCTTGNAVPTGTGGLTVIPLTKPGNRYFICGTPGHCKNGMKMAVNVVAASVSSPAAAPSVPTGGVEGPAASDLGPARSPLAGGSDALSQPSAPSSATRDSAMHYLIAFVVAAVAVVQA